MMNWYFRACPACGGDLCEDTRDRAWATCMMCARSFKVRDVAPGRSALGQEPEALESNQAEVAA